MTFIPWGLVAVSAIILTGMVLALIGPINWWAWNQVVRGRIRHLLHAFQAFGNGPKLTYPGMDTRKDDDDGWKLVEHWMIDTDYYSLYVMYMPAMPAMPAVDSEDVGWTDGWMYRVTLQKRRWGPLPADRWKLLETVVLEGSQFRRETDIPDIPSTIRDAARIGIDAYISRRHRHLTYLATFVIILLSVVSAVAWIVRPG